MARVALLLAAIAVVHCSASVNLPRKQLGGPPSEFAQMTIPDATKGALYHDSALFFVQFQQTSDNFWAYEQDLAVDSVTGFSLAIVTPVNEHAAISMTDPTGAAFDLEQYAVQTYWPVGDTTIETTVYEVPQPQVGIYKLSMTITDMPASQFHALTNRSRLRAQAPHHGLVILDNDSEEEIFTHLSSYRHSMRQNDDLKIVASMYDETANPSLEQNKGFVPKALQGTISTAQMEVIYPDGSIHVSDMHDDGLHADGQANDGVYGGDFYPSDTGYYLVQAVLKGTNSAGNAFVRTAEHPLKVVANDISFTGRADMSLDLKNQRVVIDLEVNEATAPTSQDSTDAGTYRAHLQLYGHSLLTGEEVPIAWASAVVDTSAVTATQTVSLEVDFNWLVKAGAVGPFVAKDVFLQEINTFVPVAEAGADLRVGYSAHHHATLNATITSLAATYTGDITHKMRFGVRPMANLTRANGERRLVMLHGYCADRNPWESQPEDWPTDTLYVHDLKQSRSHDEYSSIVAQFVADNGVEDFALIGHSQGGIVTMHTYNYYWSGLDNAAAGVRKIQSLASPYQGNSAAGSLSELLESMSDCGANSDLTRDGAELWLAGLSPAATQDQYYYTTQYDKGGLFGGGYCNMLVNAVMKKPNDGATENIYADLEGANFVNNFVGQCHIPDMNWPPSYWDHDRNAEMRAAAGF